MPTDGAISRDSVLQSLADLSARREKIDVSREIRRLSIAIENAANTFALLFSVCNNREVEEYISGELFIILKKYHPVEFELTGGEDSLLDALLRAPGGSAPLVVHGLSALLSSSKSYEKQRDRTLRELQLRREQFRQLGRPLLLWMPEYVYVMIGQKAVDFWSWQSGGYFFPDHVAELGIIQSVKIGGDVNASIIVTGDHSVVSNTNDGNISISPPNEAQVASPRGFLRGGSNLPSITDEFTGRQREVSQLQKYLSAPDIRAVVIVGSRGIGKTALALHVAKLSSNQFPDGIFVVPVGESSSPAVMASVVSALGAPARIPEDEVTLQAIYRSMFAGKRVLLIFDDVENPEGLVALLPAAPSKALITSRRSMKLPKIAEELRLDVLSTEEAVNVLRGEIGPHPATLDELNELASLCGQLPLLLHLVGSLLRNSTNMSVREVIDELRAESRRDTRGEQSSATNWGLDASLRLTSARLGQFDPDLEGRWRVLAVFPADFDALAAAAVWHAERLDNDAVVKARSDLAQLARLGLVFFDQGSSRYRFHVLIRDWASRRLPPDEWDRAAERHARHFQQVLTVAERLYMTGGQDVVAGLDWFDRERRNIEAGWRWVAERSLESVEMAKLCSEYAGAGPHVLFLRQQPLERIAWLEKAVAAARLAGDRQTEGRHLSALGEAYAERGDLSRAAKIYEQALVISRELGDRRGEATVLHNLGIGYADLGDLNRATDLLEHSLSIVRMIGDRRGEGVALRSLGATYAERGEISRATELFEHALELSREVGDRRGVGNSFANLGGMHLTTSRLEARDQLL